MSKILENAISLMCVCIQSLKIQQADWQKFPLGNSNHHYNIHCGVDVSNFKAAKAILARGIRVSTHNEQAIQLTVLYAATLFHNRG